MLLGQTVTIYSKDHNGKEVKRTVKIENIVGVHPEQFYECFDVDSGHRFLANKQVYDKMFGHPYKPVKPPHFKGKTIGRGKIYS